MTKIDADWLLSRSSQKICALFEDAGYEAYFVGGCVRNTLMGLPASDLDISTNALPNQVMALAKASGIKAIPTGIDHGTVTLVEGGVPFEITTFRKDVETDGRHAVVAFSKTMLEDAQRRDFTMNALFADARGEVFDPIGGLPDLQAGHVRFIGNPQDRIVEDYLRILRFFRFSTWYGNPVLGIDQDALAACAEHQDGIDTLSAERVGNEMRKLLSAENPAMALASMQACGVLKRLLPGAEAGTVSVLVHLEDGLPPDPMRRLALLGGEGATEGFRLSKVEQKRISLFADEVASTKSNAELAYRFGEADARSIALLRAVLLSASLAPKQDEDFKLGATAQFPVASADLMPQFQGPSLGAKLRELETAWIKSGFTLDRQQLLAL